jgi:hypothetical protein
MTNLLDPDVLKFTKEQLMFLQMGHFFEDWFLNKTYEKIFNYHPDRISATPSIVESMSGELEVLDGRVVIRSQVDGLRKGDGVIEEVKAIRNTAFNTMKREGNWRAYGSRVAYEAQAEAYLRVFPEYNHVDFHFINRDNCNILTGNPDARGYSNVTYLPCLRYKRSNKLWKQLLARVEQILELREQEVIPMDCDLTDGKCYHCNVQHGSMIRRKVATLEDTGIYYDYCEARDQLLGTFKGFDRLVLDGDLEFPRGLLMKTDVQKGNVVL